MIRFEHQRSQCRARWRPNVTESVSSVVVQRHDVDQVVVTVAGQIFKLLANQSRRFCLCEALTNFSDHVSIGLPGLVLLRRRGHVGLLRWCCVGEHRFIAQGAVVCCCSRVRVVLFVLLWLWWCAYWLSECIHTCSSPCSIAQSCVGASARDNTSNNVCSSTMRKIDAINTLAVERVDGTHHVYLFMVTWNSGTTTIVRHPYDALFKAHCQLLDLFPDAAGEFGEPRRLPAFPGKSHGLALTKARRQKQAQLIAEKRLPAINNYVQDLILLEPEISQSDIVLQLFDQDTSGDAGEGASSGGRATAATGDDSVPSATHGLDRSDIVRSGMLTKQGNSTKTWKSRHVLLDADGILSYYLDQLSEVPAGQIDLLTCAGVRLGADEHPPKGWPGAAERAFSVELPERTYYFQAETEVEAQGWLDAIRASVASLKATGGLPPPKRAPLVQGFISKQGGTNKTWHERFCWVTLEDEPQLVYAAVKFGPPLGSLPLNQAVAVRSGEQLSPPYEWAAEAAAGFSVELADRTYFFQCHSQQEAEKWMQATAQATQRGVFRRATVSLQRPTGAAVGGDGDADLDVNAEQEGGEEGDAGEEGEVSEKGEADEEGEVGEKGEAGEEAVEEVQAEGGEGEGLPEEAADKEA
eukprot:m.148919 g.148919  ORF g.148919 m.148919 type:complete len:638 (+) comp17333_c0_seq1:1975-3888(+)